VRFKSVKRPSQLYRILSEVKNLDELEEVLSSLDGKFEVFRFKRGREYGWEVWWGRRKLFYIVVSGGRVAIYRVFKDTDYFPEVYGLKINEVVIGE